MAGPRAMPGLVPTSPDDPATEANRAAWAFLGTSPTPMIVQMRFMVSVSA